MILSAKILFRITVIFQILICSQGFSSEEQENKKICVFLSEIPDSFIKEILSYLRDLRVDSSIDSSIRNELNIIAEWLEPFASMTGNDFKTQVSNIMQGRQLPSDSVKEFISKALERLIATGMVPSNIFEIINEVAPDILPPTVPCEGDNCIASPLNVSHYDIPKIFRIFENVTESDLLKFGSSKFRRTAKILILKFYIIIDMQIWKFLGIPEDCLCKIRKIFENVLKEKFRKTLDCEVFELFPENALTEWLKKLFAKPILQLYLTKNPLILSFAGLNRYQIGEIQNILKCLLDRIPTTDEIPIPPPLNDVIISILEMYDYMAEYLSDVFSELCKLIMSIIKDVDGEPVNGAGGNGGGHHEKPSEICTVIECFLGASTVADGADLLAITVKAIFNGATKAVNIPDALNEFNQYLRVGPCTGTDIEETLPEQVKQAAKIHIPKILNSLVTQMNRLESRFELHFSSLATVTALRTTGSTIHNAISSVFTLLQSKSLKCFEENEPQLNFVVEKTNTVLKECAETVAMGAKTLAEQIKQQVSYVRASVKACYYGIPDLTDETVADHIARCESIVTDFQTYLDGIPASLDIDCVSITTCTQGVQAAALSDINDIKVLVEKC